MNSTDTYLAKLDEKLRGEAHRAGVVEGGRVSFTNQDGTVSTGTVKRVQYTDIRVVWDEPTAKAGLKATWTDLYKLTPIN